jgi:subtilisin family serine protease
VRYFRFAGALAAAAVALTMAGCQDDSTAPEQAQPAVTSAKTSRYIVLMKETQAAKAGLRTMGADVNLLGGRVERLHQDAGMAQVQLTPAAAASLRKRPDVDAVVLDRTVQFIPPRELHASASRKLQSQSNQRGAAFFDQFQWNLKKIQAPKAWLASRQGAGVTVCVLDSGIDPRQIDLVGKLDLDISASFVGNERADRDFAAHGTYMASIITSNGIGVASVAPDARVCSVKVLARNGSGNFGDLIAALMYVGGVGGVDVANMSLGVLVPANDPDIKDLARAVQRAVNFAWNHGVLLVASTGNDAANLNDPSIINLPSSLDHIISVGATGPINQRHFERVASYSNFGRVGTDVLAPGGDFGFPNSVLEDLIIGACSPSFPDPDFACGDKVSYLLGDGTSQAAAHVSGEAAVIESELAGNQTPAELTDCIFKSSELFVQPSLVAHGRINVFFGQECKAAS